MIKKKRGGLQNVLLCYHGCVPQNQVPLTFRQHPNDIQAHVSLLMGHGYTFVLPEQYAQWQRGEWHPDYPIACLHFDDGLESVNLILPWLAGNGVPFGLALIGRRQRKKTPEADFLSWAEIKTYVDSGLCELMSHTYNMHHLTIGDVSGTPQPIMSGPPWVDDGIFMYMEPGETRPFWDWSFVDNYALGFPLLGSTTFNNTVPNKTVSSKIRFLADKSINASLVRFWSALCYPPSSGYDANIQIRIEKPSYSFGFSEDMAALYVGAAFGTYSDGQKVDSVFRIFGEETHTAKSMSYKVVNTVGTAYAINAECYVGTTASGPWTKVADISPDFMTTGWQEFDFNTPVTITKRREIFFRFLTVNDSGVIGSASLIRIYVNQYNTAPGCFYINNEGSDIWASNYARGFAFLRTFSSFGPYNAATVFSGVFAPYDYSTRSQWPEREMATITFDSSFALTAGEEYFIKFDTLNTGNGMLLIYAILDQGASYSLRNNILEPSDFPNEAWPARPVMILGSGDGALTDLAVYNAFVQADLEKNNQVIADYLHANWVQRQHGFDENNLSLYVGVVSGTYSNGRLADNIFRLRVTEAHVAEVLSIKYVRTVGHYYPIHVECYIGTSTTGPWLKVSYFQHNFSKMDWQDIDLDAPYAFDVGDYWIRFKTVSQRPPDLVDVNTGISYFSPGFMLAYVDQVSSAGPGAYYVGTEESDYWGMIGGIVERPAYAMGFPFIRSFSREVALAPDLPKRMIYPFGAYNTDSFGPAEIRNTTDISESLKVVLDNVGLVDGHGIWPTLNRQAGHFNEPGVRHTEWAQSRMLIYGDINIATQVNNILAYCGALWRDVQHGGVRWQTAIEPDAGGNATLKNSFAALSYVAFDAWFFNPSGGLYKSAVSDGGSYLTFESITGTISAGQTITGPSGSGIVEWFNNDPDHYVAKITGGVGGWANGEVWTTASGSGVVSTLQTIPDEKSFLQSRGIKCLLIISNYSFSIGDVSADLAATVVSNPLLYVSDVVDAIVDGGWDGVTINLESVPAINGAQATAFISAVADEMHSRHLLCHMTAPAKTGTAYDLPSWTDWCDHAALIKRVDAMKIMSYTESGPFSDPGPHAPKSFWDLVYFYMARTIPARFRKRLLCGCNAHSDVWQTGVTGEATYSTYWDALAAGLLRGAMIETRDSEGYWSKFGYTSYMGIPNTMQRAVDEALIRRLGGIGSWKADDGDIYSMFPHHPQIGRVVKRAR